MVKAKAEGFNPVLLWRRHAEAGDGADVSSSGLVTRPDGKDGGALTGGFSTVFPPVAAVLALGYTNLAWARLPVKLVAVWAVATLILSLLPLLLSLARRHVLGERSDLSGLQTGILAFFVSIAWAALPALFFHRSGSDFRLFGAAIVFVVTAIGAFALPRAPGAALAFVAVTTGTTAIFSLRLDGDIGVTLASFAVLYGVALSAIVINSHLTLRAQRLARGDLRRQQEIVSFLLNDFEDGAQDWLWEAGPDFNLTYASPKLLRMLGTAAAEGKGIPLSRLAGESHGAADWQSFQSKLIDQQTVAGHEIEMRDGSQSRWLRLTARPLRDAAGKFIGYRGVGRDITAEKSAHDELVKAKEAAEQANASKSHFLAVMSHELKTPLNAIVGFSELLASSQAEQLSDEARIDHLRTIQQSSRHLQSLINDILDATRIEKGTMKLAEQDADAAELLEVAVKMCRDIAEQSDCTIVARIMEGIEVRGDITRIKQILINLLTNAVKFSPAKGYVYAGIERTAGGGLAFTIRDSGFGIRPEDIARIFEPFVQAEEGMARRFGGMGLGLSIARRLARLHGGDVTLESDLGAGTTARLILPQSRVDWPQAASAATSAA